MRAARASLCAVIALTLASSFAVPARAAGSAADREAARTLSGKGYEAFEAKEYRRAIDLFRQAEAHFHAPPHFLYLGRAQVKLGLFVEARDTFERVVAEKLAADASAPFKDAQASARAELTEVETLTPSVVVTLVDPVPGARVLFDGEPVPLDRPLPRNPGAHTVMAEAPGMMAEEQTVVLKVGGRDERVALRLVPLAAPSVVPAVIAFAAGAAFVGAGTAGAILVRNATPPHTTALRALEIGGFALGGAGIVTGVVLLIVRPATKAATNAPRAAHESAPLPRLHVGVGLGLGLPGASIGGSF
jgi:hypothetical protein